MMLLLKESKKTLVSIAFLVFIGVMCIDLITQYGNALSEPLTAPVPGQESYMDYGHTNDDDPEVIMQAALTHLIQEYQENSYASYPFGFYKEVRLNVKKRTRMDAILEQLTGLSAEALLESRFAIPYYTYDNDTGALITATPENSIPIPTLSDHVTYAQFEALMAEACDLVGGGSNYEPSALARLTSRPVNYEEALDIYERLSETGFSSGYAQLMCDYLCIFAALFPSFIAVAEWLRDKSARMRDLIYTRQSSSMRITFTRYMAIVALCMLVVWLLAGACMVLMILNYGSALRNPLNFLGYAAIWILPSIMISAALGVFFTELTDTPIGLLVMVAFWFLDLNSGDSLQIHDTQWFTLMPRHNTLFGADEFQAMWNVFLQNRILIAAAALLLVCIAAGILEQKRRGRWMKREKTRRNITNQSAA